MTDLIIEHQDQLDYENEWFSSPKNNLAFPMYLFPFFIPKQFIFAVFSIPPPRFGMAAIVKYRYYVIP
jgi:hypothetical protein